MYYLIYQITNKLNKKIYIGKHKTTDIHDNYMGSGMLINHAIEKYGIENFEKTILFECASEEEMNVKEKEIVNEDFVAREDTYNLKVGGDGGWDYINNHREKYGDIGFAYINKFGCSPEKREKIKNTLKSKCKEISLVTSEKMKKYWKEHPHPWNGRHHKNESKIKIGIANSIHQSGKGNSQYGKHWWMNPKTGESKSIHEGDPIPEGWIKGRTCK